ncbi:hypothetical protein FZC79_22230 [Rossellomorea vietnamensis]|uniref:Uncharacterized protein n=1 Tax=Rossellomorea vietnamensis TaxID=218284 RepID=A0A5D4K5E6_9BACI|nr:hypothetical protein [Rossellomorea vietnamensis]TYR72597.1 hypothetical protein FZC79_22230 [Rossellomorea vietnamensis]
MQTNGMARGYMVRVMKGEDFLKHVAETIERQLKEWDVTYVVILMKLKDYEMVIRNGNQENQVVLTEQEIQLLQNTGLYQLDNRIWRDLINQGLVIHKGYGNYLSTVL